MNWVGCLRGLKVISLWRNKITEINWQDCPQGLEKIDISDNLIAEINCEDCPLYLKNIEPYNEEYKEYKKTLDYKTRFYSKENLITNLLTKELTMVNDEIKALSIISDNHHVKVFNTKIFKENYRCFIETLKNDMDTINDI